MSAQENTKEKIIGDILDELDFALIDLDDEQKELIKNMPAKKEVTQWELP